MKQTITPILLLLVVAACSDSGLLADLGERSHEYVEEATTTTLPGRSTSTDAPRSGVRPVEEVRWFNQALGGETSNEAAVVISAVWQRGNDEGRFIQATPREIAVALPGIQFPALVPDTSRSITSQLVYDAASATLDIDVSAAFGLWEAAPYQNSESRLAVLRVGQSLGTPGDPGIIPIDVEDGISLTWSDGAYRYELFCVGKIPEDTCREMAESVVPLEVVAPLPPAPTTEATTTG